MTVVAFGGSAGALAAVRGVIAGLPARSGIAYILVQHLVPDQPSLLAGLLADETPFPVIEASDGMALLQDRLHVIPPGVRLSVENGLLQLAPAAQNSGPRLPVDHLLQSLARADDLRVAAVLLSGNGEDGSAGVRALHDAGGYVIAQDPAEAGHGSMPATAIATGCVDAVLPVAAIGAAIIDWSRRSAASGEHNADDGWIAPVIERLKQSGHDFSGYKIGTMQRRIQRRAQLSHHGHTGHGPANKQMSDYLKRLQDDEDEVAALASDLLINVTAFFRDTEVFAALEAQILPELVHRHDETRPIRVWCEGCSTGEEAWSIAMLLLEQITRSRPDLKLQMFATDLDPDAVASARRGVYPASIVREISNERLQRFFVPDVDGWRVGRALQAAVVFAVHDVLADPPFARLDLISCRNLLIYLQPAAQARALSLFHFGLRPGGLLLLGTAETVPESADPAHPAFTVLSREAHVYQRSSGQPNFPELPAPAARVRTAAGRSLPEWQAPAPPSARLSALEAEMASIRAELAEANQNPAAAGSELQAINADMASRNADFQSANEELVTSQEELQSLNEELVALNGQLQETIDRQRTLSDDLENILNSTNIATIFLDMNNHIRFFTPATRMLFNMLPSDIGRPFGDLAPSTPDPALAGDIAAVRSGAEPDDQELQSRDGTWFTRRVQPYRTHDGHTQGVIITYTDVTERKHAQQVTEDARKIAETANLAKSRFLAAASHDLRQPLQSLVLLQELLASKTSDPESLRLLGRLDHTLVFMATMLDGLLDINRIEADAVEVLPTSFALDEILAETVRGLSMQASTAKLRLRHVPTSVHVMSDRRLLEGMVRNLTSNALKYTIKGGVLVGVRRRGGMARIEVWDTGIGIPADQHEAIFEPYHQVVESMADRSRGMGLGLSIVQSMGKMLGHDVAVRSKAGDGPGHGSVFSITVPLALAADGTTDVDGAEADAPAAAIVPQKAAAKAATTILLIDDDADVLDLLGQSLRERGHNVITALDEDEAAASLLHAAPDLIISDFRLLGKRDGLELAQDLRADLLKSHGRSVPVIMLTGDIAIDVLVRFAANDVVRLSKPVRPAELHAAIKAALDHGSSAAARAAPGKAADADKTAAVATDTVHVIDDDAGVLEELGTLLGEAGLSVKLHASSEAFRAKWRPTSTGCLLIDAVLPGESGLDLLRSLQAAGTLPPSIVITGQGDVAMAVAAMKAGALDFIEKPAPSAVIIESIKRALAAGARAAGDNGNTERSAAAAAAAARLVSLTPRQRQVMTMVLDGHPSKNIAADLNLSQRTVENHRAEIMHRSGCKSLPELARLVMISQSAGALPS